MAQPAHTTYSVGAGEQINAGRTSSGSLSGGVTLGDVVAAGSAMASLKLEGITLDSTDAFAPEASPSGQPVKLYLHGSGTNPLGFGEEWHATCTDDLAYSTDETLYWGMRWNNSGALNSSAHYIEVMPRDRHPDDNDGSANLNSYHMGFTTAADTPRTCNLITERRMDALLRWVELNYPQASLTRRYMTGSSVGAWACMTYGLRRPTKFAAIYPDRPRVRYNQTGTAFITVPDWDAVGKSITYNLATQTPPNRSAIDGGGSMAEHMDAVAYVANTANAMPWLGFVIGRNDGYVVFDDIVALIAALREAGRGFACSWNNGNHSSAPPMSDITSSYYYGLFEVGVGYPIFSNNSGDQDPAVDLVGGINLGFRHRNVVESAGAWSCEVTNLLGARTVDVAPKSSIYTGSTTPKSVSIPSAGTYVAVAFP